MCFAFLGLWAVSKIKKHLMVNQKPSNLAQTIGFHHQPFLSKLDARTVPRRDTLNLHWDHAKSLEILRFLAAPAGWDPWRLAERLADSPNLIVTTKRWETIRFPYVFTCAIKRNTSRIKSGPGLLGGRNENSTLRLTGKHGE